VAESTDLIIVPTAYDGADLAELAATCGLTPEEVIALHSGATYTVAFCGFVPGFSYLVGLPAALHLPRRVTPRTRVPAGSVAIAAEFTAIYPRESPGGWHLLGATDLVLWDDGREPAATLPPGTRVRFQPR
jgi:KipI family sensor histidine kinase inhibitor